MIAFPYATTLLPLSVIMIIDVVMFTLFDGASGVLMVPPVSQNASVVTGLTAGVGVDEVLR